MPFTALFHLLWRPGLISALLVATACGAAFLMGDWMLGSALGRSENFFSADSASRYAAAAAILLPILVGLVVGDASRDLRHRPFSFLLPGLGRALLLCTVLTAMALAIAVSLLHGVYLGSRLPLCLVSTAFLAFAYGATLMDRPLGMPVLLVSWACALAAAYQAEFVLDAAQAHPWISAALSLGIGGFLIAHLHAHGFHRRLVAQGAFLSLFNAFDRIEQARFRAERIARASPRSFKLSRPWLGADFRAWVRAIRVQDLGSGRGTARTGLLALWSLGVAVTVAAVALLDGWEEDGSLRTALVFLHHALVNPPEGLSYANQPPYYLAGLILAAWMWLVCGASSANLFGLRWIYPLSRADRARIAYRALSIDATVFISVAAIGLTLAAVLAAMATDETGLDPSMSDWADWISWKPWLGTTRTPLFVWQLALVVVLLPPVLACQVHMQDYLRSRGGRLVLVGSMIGLVAFCTSIAIAQKLQGEWLEASRGALPALLHLAAIVSGQLWLKKNLARHFGRVDLA